ncbi:hypothetical protein [Exiguobacterium artemiae]|uniref:hypothetical protein n=1 Tax=Exiguobacterium artemiae TaxID=340145 RepID=UPI003D01B6F1
MIHIHIPDPLLIQHKSLASDSSQLKKDVLFLKENIKNELFFEIINYISSNLEQIVSCNFEKLKKIQKEYLTLVYRLENILKINTNKFNDKAVTDFLELHAELSEVFLKAYDNFTKRNNVSWNSYVFLKKLNQTVCPYCNANFINIIQSKQFLSGSSSRGMADLDHFLPKSIFPIFAISLSNLVPSCIYCNQRFKRTYYTNFSRNFSPYDKNLINKFKFNIIYPNEKFESAFDKLIKIKGADFSKEEEYYLKLISLKKSVNLSEIEKLKKDKKIDMLLLEINKFENDNKTMYECILNISKSTRLYLTKLHQLILLDKEKLIEFKENLISELSIECEKIILERKKYETLEKKKRNQRTCITNLKEEVEKNLKKIKKIYGFNLKKSLLDEIEVIKEVDFVDIALGKSDDYKIGINANCESDFEKYMLYNNVALFQLEAVYNEYRGYVNKKIEQSYVLNTLYKSQLQKQFPNLFQEYSIDSLSNIILVDKQNQKNEILGKLIYDLVLPKVKFDH